MEKIEIPKEEYASLIACKANVDAITKTSESYKKEILDLDAKVKKVEAENEDLKEKAKAVETKEAELSKREAEAFVDDQIKAFKVKPKYKDHYVGEYIRVMGNAEALGVFKAEIEDRDAFLDAERKTKGTENEKLDTSTTDDTEEKNRKIEEYAKKHSISWAEAYKKLTNRSLK